MKKLIYGCTLIFVLLAGCSRNEEIPLFPVSEGELAEVVSYIYYGCFGDWLTANDRVLCMAELVSSTCDSWHKKPNKWHNEDSSLCLSSLASQIVSAPYAGDVYDGAPWAIGVRNQNTRANEACIEGMFCVARGGGLAYGGLPRVLPPPTSLSLFP